MTMRFLAPGFVGPLLLLLGLVALAIAVRRFLELRRERLAPAALQKSLERAVQTDAPDTALAQAMGSHSCLGQLVAAALQLRSAGLDEMLANAAVMAAAVNEVIEAGWRVVIVHGNGPQVGNLALQQEATTMVPAQPLALLGAMTQGQLGSLIARAIDLLRGPGFFHIDESLSRTFTFKQERLKLQIVGEAST